MLSFKVNAVRMSKLEVSKTRPKLHASFWAVVVAVILFFFRAGENMRKNQYRKWRNSINRNQLWPMAILYSNLKYRQAIEWGMVREVKAVLSVRRNNGNSIITYCIVAVCLNAAGERKNAYGVLEKAKLIKYQ